MQYYQCTKCGGRLIENPDGKTMTCEACDSVTSIPGAKDDLLIENYNRANELRKSGRFDEALDAYTKLIFEQECGAEVYWQILLCKYGIEYVQDPKSKKLIPTCHRAQYGSILEDPDYRKVLQCAGKNSYLYEKNAEEINGVLQEILAVAMQQEKYDVFISYKETDDTTKQKTMDSFRAREIYDLLIEKGLKVFFAPESLQPGSHFEPLIFSAIHSARVMIVIGSKLRYFEAAWVKNEWKRFLNLITIQNKKVLIPVYSDVNPKRDFPKEFQVLQAVNIGTPVGKFELVEQIDKLFHKNKTVTNLVTTEGNIPNLLKRAQIFLEDKDFDSARRYYSRILDMDAENAQAYWGFLLALERCRNNEDLIYKGKHISENLYFKKAMRFADPKGKRVYSDVEKQIENRINDVKKSVKEVFVNRLKIHQNNYVPLLNETKAVKRQEKELLKKCANDYDKINEKIEQVRKKTKEFDDQNKMLRWEIHALEIDLTKKANKSKRIKMEEDYQHLLEKFEKDIQEVASLDVKYTIQSGKGDYKLKDYKVILDKKLSDFAEKMQQNKEKRSQLLSDLKEEEKRYLEIEEQIEMGQYESAWAYLKENQVE